MATVTLDSGILQITGETHSAYAVVERAKMIVNDGYIDLDFYCRSWGSPLTRVIRESQKVTINLGGVEAHGVEFDVIEQDLECNQLNLSGRIESPYANSSQWN